MSTSVMIIHYFEVDDYWIDPKDPPHPDAYNGTYMEVCTEKPCWYIDFDDIPELLSWLADNNASMLVLSLNNTGRAVICV